MNSFKIFLFLLICIPYASSFAQAEAAASNNLDVEWYAPETEKGKSPDRPKIIISGKTQPRSTIKIDGEIVTVLKEKTPSTSETGNGDEVERQLRSGCNVYEMPATKSKVIGAYQKNSKIKATDYSETWVIVSTPKGSGFVAQSCLVPVGKNSETPKEDKGKIESREARANGDGFFEVAIELPEGIVQIPVLVITPNKVEKTFLISVDVSSNNIKMNTKVTKSKPPAASKRFRFWTGMGLTYQTYKQGFSNASDLSFQTVQAPGILLRGGYWGEQWGLDFYFRDAPGKVEADAPLTVESGNYHWTTLEAKGLYQFSRGPKSRMWGLPSQWQLRFGAQMHKTPFLEVTNTNGVNVRDANLTTATLGVGLLLGQERDWSHEFAFGYQFPISASAQGGDYKISSPMAFELQLGTAYKFAPDWRIGVFSYIQSHSYSYEYTTDTKTTTGKQNLFYTTFDLRLGYEF